MSDFIFAPVARADLHEIWDYYASEIQNVDVADRIRDELFAAFEELAQTPGKGHYRSDLVAEQLRFWRVPNKPMLGVTDTCAPTHPQKAKPKNDEQI